MNLPTVEIDQKEFDVFNLAIGTSRLRKLTAEQRRDLLKYVKMLDGSQEIYPLLTRKVCDDWGLFSTYEHKKIQTALKRICERYFADIKDGKKIVRKKIGRRKKFPLALPKEESKKQEVIKEHIIDPQAQEQLKGIPYSNNDPTATPQRQTINKTAQRLETDLIDPLVEQAKLLEKLWNEFEYWSLRARANGEPDAIKAVGKYLQTIKDTIKDVFDVYQKLRANDPKGARGESSQAIIFIEKMQMAIEQNISNREGVGGVLSDLANQLETVATQIPKQITNELPNEGELCSTVGDSGSNPESGMEISNSSWPEF